MDDAPRITRRHALATAAATGAGLLLAPAAARARTAGGPLEVLECGTLAPATPVTVAPRQAFALAAVRWETPRGVRIELRTRRRGGAWGPWAVASAQGHDGDGVAADGHVGEGVWTGAATELELRSSQRVTGVRVLLVQAERDGEHAAAVATAASLPILSPPLPAGPGQPPIIARAAWAGGDHRPKTKPSYGTVEMAFVHHTESPNGYGAGAVPALLRSIYSFHVHGRGWDDIGYNFLVDRFGRIWEGREGGIDAPVVGAQAGDWNEISTGVAVLGTFTSAQPPRAALAALQRLLAWKLSLHGVPATGDIDPVVQADAVSYTPFRAGEHVHLPRIAGHRDGDSTTCPGDALYRRLPALRPRVARMAGTPAVLTLQGALFTMPTGPVVELTGRLTRRDAGPLAGAPVQIESLGDSGPLVTVLTDAQGRFSATVAATRELLLRALHGAQPAAVSDVIAVVRAKPVGRRRAPHSLRLRQSPA